MNKNFKLGVLALATFATLSLASCGDGKKTTKESQATTEQVATEKPNVCTETSEGTCAEVKDCSEQGECGAKRGCSGDCSNCPNR